MKRITDGLPVFWLVDGEYHSRCGGLLLDGGQEGKLTFTPKQLHDFLCDVCRGVNRSAHIWRSKVKVEEKSRACVNPLVTSNVLMFFLLAVLSPRKSKQLIRLANHTWWNTMKHIYTFETHRRKLFRHFWLAGKLCFDANMQLVK